jgi:hypothetical protein
VVVLLASSVPLSFLPSSLLLFPLEEKKIRSEKRKKTTYVDEVGTGITNIDNLDTSLRAVFDLEVGGKWYAGNAEGALASDVPKLRREGNVKVCDVGSDTKVDKDVRPRVCKVELEGAAV